MQKLINLLRGSVRLEVAGAFPERFLNLCAQRGVAFWGVEWRDGNVLRVTVARRDVRRAEALGERVLCDVVRLNRSGVPYFLGRFRKRYAFLAGLTLSLLAVCILSRFILTVDVVGNETVSTAQILSELRRQGVRPGTYGPSIDERKVSNEALLQLPGLSWMAINLHGTRAEVLVRETLPEPQVVDENELGDVVAEAPGIITHMEVEEGQALFQEGDTVLEGEVVISGAMRLDPPEYSGLEPTWRQVRAGGRVFARTWRTLTAEIPMEGAVKTYTGETESRWFVNILGRRINFYTNGGISFAGYDKITEVWTAALPGGQSLPLALGRETARAYETAAVELDREAACALLEGRLQAALREQVGDGEVVSMVYTDTLRDGMLTVTLAAECREEIGRFAPWPAGAADTEEEKGP